MSQGPKTTFWVLGTRRTWKTRSSFVEFRAIVRVYRDETPPSAFQMLTGLYLVVLEGRQKETLIATYRIPNATLDPKDFGTPIAKAKAEALPSAKDLRIAEKYGNQALAQTS